MPNSVKIEGALRDRILTTPEVILEDRDVMRALIGANERAMGDNIIDMRGLAMARLEDRLDRLEVTHRSVIAAAYDNLSGTHSVHRAVLRLLDAVEFDDFLAGLCGEAADSLRVDAVRLVLESTRATETALDRLGDVLSVTEPGTIEAYAGADMARSDRKVILREAGDGAALLYGLDAGLIGSEALILLDLGTGRLPGLLALGAANPAQFRPGQAIDLLGFFGGVCEREMRRWLA